jgi:hypothetical protein
MEGEAVPCHHPAGVTGVRDAPATKIILHG